MERTSTTAVTQTPSFVTPSIAVTELSITRYLEDLALSGLRRSTIQVYRFILHSYRRAVFDLSPDSIRTYLVGRQDDVAPATLYLHSRVVRRFAEYHGVDCSKLPKVKPAQSDSQRRLHATEAQVHELLAYLRARYREKRVHWRLRDLAVTMLLFGAGLRIGEVVGLCVQDVDIARREVFLRDTKTKRAYFVAIPPSVAAVLRLYLIARHCLARDTDRLFLCEDWKPVSCQRLRLMIQRAGRAIGVEISTHTGRRFCITQLAYNAGVYVAMQQARHTNLGTTQKYLREDRSRVRAAVRLNDPLG